MQGRWTDLGRMAYEPAWEIQRLVVDQVLGGAEDTLLFVEHDPVLTLGASFHESNLLLSPEQYAAMGIALSRTDRGGDVTYHGPRQLVIYPIFDISRHGKDLHKWLRDLEEVVIRAIGEFGLVGRRFPPHTGVWVGDRKVAAMGVKVRRWVSQHGIALNCNNDLAPFGVIVPCGIQGYGVTSLERETGRPLGIADAMPVVVRAFEQVFDMKLRQVAGLPELGTRM